MLDTTLAETNLEFQGEEGNRLAATLFEPNSSVSGPPVLFMHGGGQTRHSWEAAARLIGGMGLTALTVDARGHGDSEWVTSGNYSFDYYCADLIALAKQIAGQFGRAPVLVGASMGGISAMLAQDQAGSEIFEAIVLVDITPRMQSSGVDRIMGFMAENMRKGFGTVDEAADVIADYLPNRPRPKSNSGLAKNLRLRDDGRYYWHWDPGFVESQQNIAIGREDRINILVDAVKSITVPTLLVRGSKSELVTRESADEFLELVPHAKYVDVTDAGHMVAGDKNDVFANAVIEFLRAEVLA